MDEEKEETSLDCWLSAKGGEGSCCGTVSAEGGNVIDRSGKHDKCKAEYRRTAFQGLSYTPVVTVELQK